MAQDKALRLRPALPEDAAAIRDLTLAAYAKWVPVVGRKPLPMEADYETAVRQHVIELLFAGKRLVALVETIPQPDHLLIENLAVLPEEQGKGHGLRLLRRAEEIAADLGLKELRLYTNQRFAGNVAFYKRRGYGVDREEPFQGGVLVHMSKRLR